MVILAVAVAALGAVWHVIVEAAMITALTVVSAAGLAAVTGIGYASLRVLRWHATRQDRRRAVFPGRPVPQVPPAGRPALEEPSSPVPGPAREYHLHLHGLTAEQIAAIVTRRDIRPGARPWKLEP